MFDFVTRRRLIFCLGACLFATISILFIARLHSKVIRHVVPFYSSSSNVSIVKEQTIVNACYLTETYQTSVPCEKCTAYERRSNAVACSPTGYRETIECFKSKIKTYRTCPIPAAIQERQFWLFEGFIMFLGLISIVCVHSRQKILDKQMVEKIRRQIGENEQ